MTDTATRAQCARLDDRGVVSVVGPDATKFLNGLVTNEIAGLMATADDICFEADVRYAGLLTPQGKILFDFFCVKIFDGFILEMPREKTPDLVKRLAMYKLRAAVDITDASDKFTVLALWGENACSSGPTRDTVAFRDPRHQDLGFRILAEAHFAADIASATNGQKVGADAYHAHRIALGIPEGGKDFAFGDAVPHDANFDLVNGVSFTKGCFVGQEVVARMQNKSIVRKRVARITSTAPLAPGVDILLGDVPIGQVGSVSSTAALAMIRLDRVMEADDKGIALTCGGTPVTVDAAILAQYRAAAATGM